MAKSASALPAIRLMAPLDRTEGLANEATISIQTRALTVQGAA